MNNQNANFEDVSKELKNGFSYNWNNHEKFLTVTLITSTYRNQQYNHLMIYDRNFILNFDEDLDNIFGDGTYDSRAKIDNCSQLLTLLTKKNGFVSS